MRMDTRLESVSASVAELAELAELAESNKFVDLFELPAVGWVGVNSSLWTSPKTSRFSAKALYKVETGVYPSTARRRDHFTQ